MKRTLSPMILFAATQLLAACGVPMEEEQSPFQDEAVQTQEQAISESCTNSAVSLAQPDGAAVTFRDADCGYENSAATSIDGSYDQPLCSHSFVTEVQQVNGRSFTAFVEAVPATTDVTEYACGGVLITGKAWGYNGSSWVSLGSVSTTGVWHPESCGDLFCFPAYCQLSFSIGNMRSGYSKVRVAGFAAALGVFKGRVRTGVFAGPGSCR